MTPATESGVECCSPSRRAGQPAHRVRSDADGRFKLRLTPGRYRVRAGASATRVMPVAVIVPLKGFARVTITVGSRGVMP